MCPHCRQNAPIVYRGVLAYCTACGQLRAPLAGPAVNLAGQPSQIGGSVANVLGWIVLAVGVVIAVLLTALLQAIFPAGFVGWLFGAVITLVTLVVGSSLVLGGRRLKSTGSVTEKSTKHRAIYALAAHRGGVLNAMDVSRAAGLSVSEADALLTALAKEESDSVKLEVDENGGIYYVFPEFDVRPWEARSTEGVMRTRVAPAAQALSAEREDEAESRREAPSVQRTR
jgi:hypothetical protein